MVAACMKYAKPSADPMTARYAILILSDTAIYRMYKFHTAPADMVLSHFQAEPILYALASPDSLLCFRVDVAAPNNNVFIYDSISTEVHGSAHTGSTALKVIDTVQSSHAIPHIIAGNLFLNDFFRPVVYIR